MTTRRGLATVGVAAAFGLAVLGGLAHSTEAGPDKMMGPPPGAPPPPMMMPFPPPPPPIADVLARAEVEIGIRAQQMDAWRDFTDAALSVLEPPRPPKPPRSDAKDEKDATEAQPFAKAVALADDAIARGKKAEQLKTAVDTLKSKLSPEQLKKVVELEARMAPPPPPPVGFGKMSPGTPPPSPHP